VSAAVSDFVFDLVLLYETLLYL